MAWASRRPARNPILARSAAVALTVRLGVPVHLEDKEPNRAYPTLSHGCRKQRASGQSGDAKKKSALGLPKTNSLASPLRC